MADDLARLESTPGNLYNFHPGSHVKQGTDVGISYIADMLNEILNAGSDHYCSPGNHVRKRKRSRKSFEELKEIIDKVEIK